MKMGEGAPLLDVPREQLGAWLLDHGWTQGAVFRAEGAECSTLVRQPPEAVKLAAKPRVVRAQELLVVVSQDCDILARPDIEPHVEALICKPERRRDYLDSIDRNSPRYFVVDPAEGMVAQACYRVLIAKAALI